MTEINKINDFATFLEDLKDADPDMGEMLDEMLENYDVLLKREVRKKQTARKAMKNYFQTEKGKIKNREANKRYYYKHKKNKSSVEIPKKNIEE